HLINQLLTSLRILIKISPKIIHGRIQRMRKMLPRAINLIQGTTRKIQEAKKIATITLATETTITGITIIP
ncbi:hypothetical protein, partial [Autumnicola edwardsiae]